MKSRQLKIILAIVALTALLTWFFYAHETFPKPLRAVTAVFSVAVALASGLSNFLDLGVPVYETPWAVILANLLFAILIVFMVDKFINRRKDKSRETSPEV